MTVDARALGRQPNPLADRERLGEMLVDRGLLRPEHLETALSLQKRWRSRLGEIVLAHRWMSAVRLYRALSDHFGLDFVDLVEHPPEVALDPKRFSDCAERQVIPWRHEGNRLVLAVADPGADTFNWARRTFGSDVLFVGTSKFDILWSLQLDSDFRLTHDALTLLADRAPEHSAREVITRPQLLIGYSLLTLLLVALAWSPVATLIGLNVLITLGFLATFVLKLILVWYGSRRRIDVKVTDDDVASLREEDLPVYTVLVPMYREPEILPVLANALRKLDYPASKLDIKLVLESDDRETIEAAKRLGLEAIFEIIRVPPSSPRTKPKACNYALRFARGQFVTIFDAEDKPEPEQLKRVVAAFAKSAPEVVCVQARLNYYNANENWLTRMFTLEYTLWFDFYLPALEYLRIPIPLGGTSNHFRIEALRSVYAWDPYNVTEDADLGVRLVQQGYRVSVVNSTTFEEANVSVPNWIRQRSRWFKGYMQTWLVHMRDPVHLYQSTGFRGFWGFQFFIGGGVLTALAAPLLWLIYGLWLAAGTRAFDFLFPPALVYLSLLNLLLANGFFIYMTMVAGFKRNYFNLAPYALTVPLYWLLQSFAAYKGLWQLISKPFYWEKTNHGISKYAPAERKAALRE
ncbi:glycosyltransferase [Halopseudomonas nanhaiensis]|uniref:glycosyltransferase family 2 protein n=1 Tax=Halopseudomonas nanhaiensis TaxID=2830842 RepID=UPI001CC12233|nr:glycosyltransferase family 2 protein [Halopseudomonas nanhaiensis]UAW97417.1 glycosyltransferase [Halopseudomonas nanhaiensis]